MAISGYTLVIGGTLYSLFKIWSCKTSERTLQTARYLLLSALGIIFMSMVLGIFSAESDSVTYEVATSWFQILAICFVLSAFSILIRELKPIHTRYPLQFAGLPLLLIPTFLLIDDSETLKDLLNIFLQGGSLLVLMVIAMVVTEGFRKQFQFPAAVLIAAITYGLYWFLPEDAGWPGHLWTVLFTTAIILFGNSLPPILKP